MVYKHPGYLKFELEKGLGMFLNFYVKISNITGLRLMVLIFSFWPFPLTLVTIQIYLLKSSE